jgi:cell division ATPase FtsA
MTGPMDPNELLFALDVGTRKVCGLLVRAGAGGAGHRVEHLSVREHPGRAMLDGQVHVIASAARVLKQVKDDLEAQSGLDLRHAHVAVAGRNLASSRVVMSFRTGHGEPLTRSEIAAMELQAVREARLSLDDPRAAAGAYCVGYHVQSLRLDGEPLLTLEGHRGAEAELGVIATFLPKRALDALQAALAEAGLSPASLTLEPIAAVNLAVPAELRRLNLGFVDVGAGTSDIALTKGGRVDSFAMVPVAGDEASERLADAYVLDFMQAEALKRALGRDEMVEVMDLFGAQRRIASSDALRELAPALRHWAGEVAAALRSLNGGQAPQAVLLAGGGSLLPGCEHWLADALGLAPGRVGRRPVALQDRFVSLPAELDHAWAVTPLGIAASALDKRGLPFAHFQVNGRWVQVLNLDKRFSAFDALLASGKERVQFIGRPGLGVTYTFNGAERVAKGAQGKACRLYVNGAEAPLEAEIADGASLTFVDALSGSDGRLTLAQALEREGLAPGRCRFNDAELELPLQLFVDGFESRDLSAAVPDRARLEARPRVTLRRLLQDNGVEVEGLIQREVAVTLDGEPRVLVQRNYRLRLGGHEAPLDAPVQDGDEVLFEPGAGFQERVRDLLALAPAPSGEAPAEGAWKVRLNGEWAPLNTAERVMMNGREVGADEFLIDGADVRLARARPCRHVGEALLRLGLQAWVADPRLRVRLNGAEAGVDAALRDGDALDLSLEQGSRRG